MHDVAFIGTGDDPDDPDMSGFAMAYHHARAYEHLESCALVACADIKPANAAAFAETFDIEDEHCFEDYEEMLAAIEPDIISVCVPPAIHAAVVVDCARHGPAAIHCEKPMDLTWGGARRMAEACWRRDIQLTFNHQRRFKPSGARARELIDAGTIGDIERVELTPPNIFDWGTHAVDFAGAVIGDRPAEWVIGQIDYRSEQHWFGAHNENQAHAMWRYDTGVNAVIATGVGATLTPALLRFIGSDGLVDIDPRSPTDEAVNLRWRTDGGPWESEAIDDGPWTDSIDAAIAHIITCLETGTEPELSARRALNATEIIFGIWESSRRRARVDFPLEIDDNPLEAMVASGKLSPDPAEPNE